MKAPTTAARTAAPKQSLAPRAKTEVDQKVTYTDLAGNNVNLSMGLIKDYLCPGQNISDAEAYMFLSLCQYQRLNPFVREAYCVKYGSNPATMIVGKETYTKRAAAHPKFKGMKAGVVVFDPNIAKRDDFGEIITDDKGNPVKGGTRKRVGELVLPGEELVGGWADVFVDGYVEPVSAEVSLNERMQKKDGKPMSKWASSPGLMIRKCALVAALREAFPDILGGMYTAEEMGLEEQDMTAAPIPQPEAQDVAYTDMATGEVYDPDALEAEFFDKEE